jgi:hypothetical protein
MIFTSEVGEGTQVEVILPIDNNRQ